MQYKTKTSAGQELSPDINKNNNMHMEIVHCKGLQTIMNYRKHSE